MATVGDFILQRLQQGKVQRLHGFPVMASTASWTHWARRMSFPACRQGMRKWLLPPGSWRWCSTTGTLTPWPGSSGGRESDSKYPTQESPDFTCADFARMQGLQGERSDENGAAVEHGARIRPSLRARIRADVNVPPLPPQVMRAQAKSYYEAIEKGNPDAQAVKAALAQQQHEA